MNEQRDNLDILLAMAAKKAAVKNANGYRAIDTSATVLDEYYYKRKRKIIRAYKSEPFIKKAKDIFSKTAVVIACILTAGFLSVVSVSALREAVWDAIVTWYEECVAVHFASPSVTETTEMTGTTPSVPTKIEKIYMPSFIIEGCEEKITVQNIGLNAVEYLKEGKAVYRYKQTVLDDRNILFDNEGVTVSEVSIGGSVGKLMQYEDGTISLIWTDGAYIHIITTQVEFSSDDILKVAESVRPVD